jgi:N-acetylglutamate synthase-like GNAT family acetyltransferase
MSGSTDLFRALEFAHYAERFRGKVFVIGLTAETPFQHLLLDIKVLTGYHIQVVLVLPDPTFQLERLIAQSNSRGTRFHLSLLTDVLLQSPGGPSNLDFARIRTVLGNGNTPVIAFHLEEQDAPEVDRTFVLAGHVAAQLEADKLFLIAPGMAPLIAALPRSHVLAAEMETLLEHLPGSAAAQAAPLFRFIGEQLGRGISDLILLEDKPAHLFREVFTHDGAGILFNEVERARIRRAHHRDVTDIGLLFRMEIEEGRILPVDENEVEANIEAYWVYEIDGLLVGSARLKPYGEWAELAQFATLPRYRGKGRARELALRMEREAKDQGISRLFALSIDERMWQFFLSLDFQPAERERLPEVWRRNYDFNRPSRAFIKDL